MEKQKTLIIAHRGASAEAEENTLAAFQKAIDMGVDFAELDIRLTKDEIPIVFHDATLSRFLKVKQAPSVDQVTLEEIQSIHNKRDNFHKEQIPTLSEVLNLDWKHTGLMIEIKKCPQKDELVVNAVFNVLNRIQKLPKTILIGSFSIEILDIAMKLNSLSNIEFIGIIEKPEMLFSFLDLRIKKMAVWHPLITEDAIAYFNKENIEVFAFTVNTPQKARVLEAIRVRGIITNNPRKL